MSSRSYFAIAPDPSVCEPGVVAVQAGAAEPTVRFRKLYDEAEMLFLSNRNPCPKFAAVVRQMRTMIESREISAQEVEAVEHRCMKELNPCAYETISDELHARLAMANIRRMH